MITQVPDSALTRGQQSPPISHHWEVPAFAAPDRTRFFRKRRFFKVFTAICAVAAAMAYVPIANAHDSKSGDHVRRAHRMTFDGRWSVVIETKRGICDSYRVGLDIVDGTVTYDGSPYGRVSAAGANPCLWRLWEASKRKVLGVCHERPDTGVWHALLNTGKCDGHWMAERRD